MSDRPRGSTESVFVRCARQTLWAGGMLFLLVYVVLPYGGAPLLWKRCELHARLVGTWYMFHSPLAFVQADRLSVRMLRINYDRPNNGNPPHLDCYCMVGDDGQWFRPKYLILVGGPWWPYPPVVGWHDDI